jgi:hypothetical protein
VITDAMARNVAPTAARKFHRILVGKPLENDKFMLMSMGNDSGWGTV